jgi:Acetyltransferase (GNAT) domain
VKFRTLDAARPEDRAAWLALWRSWPRREVMAHPDYACLFARPVDRIVCAVGEEDGGAVLFPIILRPLATEPWAPPGERRLDAVTPYGYGGPFSWGDGDHTGFWLVFNDWCRDERVVSTFARLSLFPDQLALAGMPGVVEVRAPNIVVPLAGGADAVWQGYESKVRRWIRTAEASGLRVEVDRAGLRLDAFIRVYTHTMQRNGADAWYFFPRSFFEVIVSRLTGHYAFFCTLRGEDVVSADLILCSEENVYYFLGGTLADAFPLGPNYLLKHHVASWALANGKQRYVLGGGYQPGDGLFRYKRGWARRGEVPFRVGCIVHDETGYRQLAEARAAFEARGGSSWAPRPGFFPAYRA